MTHDTRKAFRAALEADESFRDEILAATSFEGAVAAAAGRGLAITIEDLKVLAGPPEGPGGRELTDAELNSVSGGAGLTSTAGRTYAHTAKQIIQSLGR